MVEKITINPSKIRAYGNIIDDKSVEDFERYESSLVETTVTINGVSIPAYLLLYSPNNFVFDFDGNLKRLYVSEDEDTVEAFTFDSSNKRLAFSSDDVAFGFDDDNKRLYCDNDYHPTTYLVSLAVSSNTVNIGASVTLTATVTDDQETAVEGATVTFKVGGSTIDTGTTNSSGVATLSYTCNTSGSLSFSASCNGANSTSQSVTVNKLSTSTALATSSASVTVGTSVTLTATVTSGGTGVNGLTVTFKDGTSTLGTGTTNSSGVATYTTNSLTEGTHSITAVVTETSTYSTSTSTAVTVTVSAASTYIINDDASTDNSSTLFGSSISLRNSGTSTVTYTTGSPNYYEIKCTRSSSDSFIPYKPLEGITSSFKLTMKCKLSSISGVAYTGLYYYIDSNNWGGVKTLQDAQWISDKTNGTFTEHEYTTGQSRSTNYFTVECIFNSTANTLTINTYNQNDTLIQTKTMNIPITLTSAVKWGDDVCWSNGDKHGIYEIKAEYI